MEKITSVFFGEQLIDESLSDELDDDMNEYFSLAHHSKIEIDFDVMKNYINSSEAPLSNDELI